MRCFINFLALQKKKKGALGERQSFLLSPETLRGFHLNPILRNRLRETPVQFIRSDSKEQEMTKQTEAQKVKIFVVEIYTTDRGYLLSRKQTMWLQDAT